MVEISINTKIKKLKIANFRNLGASTVEFSPHINCILGGNGEGKTNYLEAIHFLFNGKSFRKGVSFPQCLSLDGDNFETRFSLLNNLNSEAKEVVYKLHRLQMNFGYNPLLDTIPNKLVGLTKEKTSELLDMLNEQLRNRVRPEAILESIENYIAHNE